jgi:hypothetical protein
MTSDVVLTAAMRNNLLSLQGTQSSIDKVQSNLATGLKVSSALDNPQSFFASESLKNRATDLSRLLDGMGQSIQTIKAADKGTGALGKLLDQAESIANEAASALDTGTAQSTITGDVVFDGSTNITDYSNISDGDTVTFSFTDSDGKAVTIDGNSGEGAGATITLSNNETVDEVIAQINAIENDDDEAVVKASLTEDGHLKLEALTGGDMRLSLSASTLPAGLGFDDFGVAELTDVDNAYAADEYNITVSKTPVVTSFELFDSNGEVADRSAEFDELYYKNASGALTQAGSNLDASTDLLVQVNGNTLSASNEIVTGINTATVQEFVDGINNDTTLNSMIEARFNDTTGQIEIRALSTSAKSVQIAMEDANGVNATSLQLGFATDRASADFTATDDGDANRSSRSIAFGEGAGQLAQLETDYGVLLEQMNDAVGDSGYRGVNLLTGDTLETYFNEDRSSSLKTIGKDLTTTGDLSLSEVTFTSSQKVSDAITEIRSAKITVRNFGSSLANSLSVIQTREEFTTNMINTLNEGSDKLVVADQNEEGAKLLALQTRQQLGVVSLSLASQAQQAVLRLF